MCKLQGRNAPKQSALWLTLLFVIQPLLDALAFWTRNDTATPAGYIRLVILILLPAWVFIHTDRKKYFFLFLLVVGIFCSLHIANCFRCGYISPATDLRYLASVIQMPVYTACLILTITDDDNRNAAVSGVLIGAAILALFYLLSWLTQTGNVTYGEGLGFSGWVIDENRNANSTLFVVYGCFSMLLALRSERSALLILIPVLIDFMFLSNGTKSCYFSIFAVFLSYSAYLLFERYVRQKNFKTVAFSVLIILSCFSALIYPLTPRYKVTQAQQQTARGTQGEIEATLLEQGIDISDMDFQERFTNPAVKEVFEHYYWKYLGVKPDLIDRFGMDRVLMQYHMSTDVGKLIDARVMERNYADLIFQDSDLLTKIVGFEVSQMGPSGYDGVYDLENDWHAIFYYYGYLGLFLYVGFILYFLFSICRSSVLRFREYCTIDHFTWVLTLTLLIGLAHFSGAVLRRPNVSIFLSLVLALCHYSTGGKHDEIERHCSCI